MLRDLLRWARITKKSDNSQTYAIQQLQYLNKNADSVMIFPYGFHANAAEDSLALMFSVQSHPENRACIAWNPTKRPTLEESEVSIYHPPTDAFIIFKSDGSIDIQTGNNSTKDMNITASSININSNVNINGTTNFTGSVLANGKIIDDTHQHVQANDSGGNSEANISGVI